MQPQVLVTLTPIMIMILFTHGENMHDAAASAKNAVSVGENLGNCVLHDVF